MRRPKDWDGGATLDRERARRGLVLLNGGHEPGYTQNRIRGKFAPGDGGGKDRQYAKRDLHLYRKQAARAAQNQEETYRVAKAAQAKMETALSHFQRVGGRGARAAYEQAHGYYLSVLHDHHAATAQLIHASGLLRAVGPQLEQTLGIARSAG